LPIEIDNPEALLLDKSVTIAVAAHGNVQASRTCLEAIFQSVKGPFELLLIDDMSPDQGATRQLFCDYQKRHPRTTVFYFTENLEYTGSVNAALSHATGKYIFFLSNDIYVTPPYFAKLLYLASTNPAAIWRGSSNFVDNAMANHNLASGIEIRTLEDIFKEAYVIANTYKNAVYPHPQLVGDAFLTVREVINTIGTFDPIFYGYFGDQDFGLRARIAGFPLRLAQGAYAYHDKNINFTYLPEDEKKLKLERRWMRVYENWARFKMKYGLPVALSYISPTDVPWEELATRAFSKDLHYASPADYSRFIVAKS
jgi:O-antigen biosynthesis protein